jgi:hypothetical protein
MQTQDNHVARGVQDRASVVAAALVQIATEPLPAWLRGLVANTVREPIEAYLRDEFSRAQD